jgi:tetratricopeptide (TPR) repeat protein
MIRSAKALLGVALLALVMHGESASGQTASKPAATDKAGAYYNFAMGHLYAELAGTPGSRSEYVNKAIEHYRQALKLDPAASYIFEELTDLYIQTGHLRDAVTEAQEMLKQNPDNIEARRILGRIYTRMIGDAQQGKINEEMVKQAIDQYKQIIAKDAKDMESWLTLGRLYRVAGNSVESEKSYKQAMEIDPNSEEALTGLAVVYADIGDTKKSIEMLRVVTERNPSPRTLAALAQSYEQMRDYKSAAEVLKKAVEVAPENGRFKRELAQNLLFSERYDEALKLYMQLAAEDPRDAQLQLRISEIYRQKRDFAKARAALDKAKELDKDNLDVRYDEVNLLDAQGKTEEAIKALKAIVDDTQKKSYSAAEKASRAMLLERLGLLHRSANRYQQAVDIFRQIGEDAESGPRVSVLIVDTYRAAKDYKKALEESNAALKKYPEERIVRLANASVLADMGKADEGAAVLRKLLSGDKAKDRDLHIAIAQLYEKSKRFAEMGKALDSAENLADTPQDKENIHFMRGAMYERMKKYDAAETEFRKVLEISPDNASALNYLGYMLAEQGVKLDEAAKLVGRALELDPHNGAYLDSLGWVYYQQNRLSEAENLLVQALERIGKDPTVHDHLGDIYLKLGKTREAIGQWQASIREYESGTQSELDPAEVAKINKKLEGARVRLARENNSSRTEKR